MKPIWIWHYRDFEFYFASKYLLAREERGNTVPAFYEIPSFAKSVRFVKTVDLSKAENIKITADGSVCVSIDEERQKNQDIYSIPAGKHKISIAVGNMYGMCAIYVEGESIVSDSTWYADGYDNIYQPVGFSPLCTDKNVKPSDYAFPEKEFKPTEDIIKENERIIDFGKNTFVKVKLENIKANTNVYYGESLEETYSDRCVITDSCAPCSETMLKERACRYIRFVSDDLTFSVKAFYPHLPVCDKSYFKTGAVTEKIYDVSKYTLELCSRMFFLDGIKRDRWPWAGDAYLTAIVNYYSFFDTEIVKRTLIALRGNETVKTPVNNILEYSFYWFMLLEDYYQYTGDSDFVKRNYEYAKVLLEYYIKKVDKYGFIPPINNVWLFIDWHDIDRNGDVCVVQMLYGKTLRSMAQFAELCEKAEDVEFYKEKYNQLKENINKYFWNASKGAYVSVFDEGRNCDEVRRHQNYLGVLFGYADEDKTKLILKNVLYNESIPKLTTPFYKFFEYEMLFKYGSVKKAFEQIENYWGKMIAAGASTVWEEFDDDMSGAEHYAMYGEPFDKSLCHAWGSTPIYFMGRYIAGVYPTDVAYKTFTVKPNTDMGDYEASVPVGKGSVTVKLTNGCIYVKTDVQGGTLILGDKKISLEPDKETSQNI